ncbi:MAG: hypothetical protein DRO04_02965 [Candidatus Iainarchaeum archaeon]|uniref:ParB-like N-terminal domain-containing protein n=1 Tax=Candidatus Iainarchaeum sp. TaxID=3101447 RepID=A0A497JGH6_9ARCH|nr:MAG: hypothetical protein DRO04_02965 [Candidatus Diapherotrites archaeon]
MVIVPVERLEVIQHQRKPSDNHVNRLKASMELLGFIAPLICVKDKNKLIVIDGQHRFLAARELGAKYLPCVIVPKEYSYYLIELNAEKTLTIKEKSYVALQLYKRILSESPNELETSAKVQESIEGGIYLVTLGLAYEAEERFVGSALDSLVKRIDDPLEKAIKSAFKIRKQRAKRLLEANKEIKRIAKSITSAIGKFPPFLYQTIVSFCSPIGRKRIIQESFDEIMDRFMENIADLKKNPEMLLKEE